MKPAGELTGKGIVVTRPAAQAAGLADAIEQAGGTALVFPALEIRDVEDLRALSALLERLESFDLAVFVSPSAVQRAFDLVRARRASGWPHDLRVAAIGPGTRRELERQGIEGVLAPPARGDSEALLGMPGIDAVAGKRVVIFRGEGGRELLGDALAARGATVEFAECYRRMQPSADPAPLLAGWQRGAVNAVTVSSGEGLANFFAMIGPAGQRWLKRTPLFVPHQRVAGQAARLEIEEVRIAGPADAGVVAALVAYFRDAK